MTIRAVFIAGDPPEPTFDRQPTIGGRGKVSLWRKRLQDRPGEWAHLQGIGTSTTMNRKQYPGFEFAQRTIKGQRRMYARYIGGHKGTSG